MIRELLKNYVLAISMSIVMVLGNLQAPALAAEAGGTNEDAAEYEIGYEEADKDAIDTAAAEDTLTAAGTDEETAEPLSATEEETAADETEAVGNEASEIETPESGGFSAGESLEAAPEAETALKAIEEEEETSDTAKAMNSFMSGDWTYETANGGVKITKYTGTESVVAIPEKLEGKTVTELGPEMMQGNRLSSYNAYAYDRFTLELRYPFMLGNTTIYGLGFLEGGNAWAQSKDFNPFKMKRSAGLGVRIFLPMVGLMGIDWAYGFDNVYTSASGAEKRGGSNFHFILGQEF